MDIIISILITFFMILFCVYQGIFVGHPLLLVFITFSCIARKRGYSFKDIAMMSFDGCKKAWVALKIFILIGAVTSIWIASGTVPAIMYYSMKYMDANLFILYTFMITCIVSFLLGTSFGTVNTVGIAFILIAKSAHVNLNMVAGAIIAGAYFGDRISPMSSSANLVAHLTETSLYTNIKNMFKTSIVPFLLSIILYIILSLNHPLNLTDHHINKEILKIFQINWMVLLPAFTILILSLFKVRVQISMMISIILAFILCVFVQKYTPIQVIKFIILGFHLDTVSSLQDILKGGGILSMLRASFVVLISCALAGVFDGTHMLKSIEKILAKAKTYFSLFIYTLITSIMTAAFGCNQSISVVLTYHLMNKSYKKLDLSSYKLAVDLENTGILLSALIPWNIAAYVPTTTMGVSPVGFIPYAFYIYLIPIVHIIYLKLSKIKKQSDCHPS